MLLYPLHVCFMQSKHYFRIMLKKYGKKYGKCLDVVYCRYAAPVQAETTNDCNCSKEFSHICAWFEVFNIQGAKIGRKTENVRSERWVIEIILLMNSTSLLHSHQLLHNLEIALGNEDICSFSKFSCFSTQSSLILYTAWYLHHLLIHVPFAWLHAMLYKRDAI